MIISCRSVALREKKMEKYDVLLPKVKLALLFDLFI